MKTIARNNRNLTLAAVAAVCLAAVAVGAHADEAVNGVPARTVHYADLNLNTQAGAAVLYNAHPQCGGAGLRRCGFAGAGAGYGGEGVRRSGHFRERTLGE